MVNEDCLLGDRRVGTAPAALPVARRHGRQLEQRYDPRHRRRLPGTAAARMLVNPATRPAQAAARRVRAPDSPRRS